MEIGKKIKERRQAMKLSQAVLAQRVGVSQAAIGKIEKGLTQQSKFLPQIARVLRIPLDEFGPDFHMADADMVPNPDGEAQPSSDDLPVYGLVEGGDGHLIISSGEIIDRFPRPAALAHVPDAYCLNVDGESMIPMFRPGDLVIIHPHLPPRREDGVVLYAAEGRAAMIKEYLRSQPHHWSLRRYQPKIEEFTVPKKEWPRCHVVYARFSRR